MEIEPLYVDGVVDGFLVKGDAPENELKKFLVDKEWVSEILATAKIEKSWYRRVPVLDECNEYCGWQLRDALPNARGAFFATQLTYRRRV